MIRAVSFVLLFLFASQAKAQDCPDFYRFVDFGLKGSDGMIYRGGPLFRAEGFSGEPLLLTDRTVCLPVRETSKDGPGNPIPVVESIAYDPSKGALDLSVLTVSTLDNAAAQAEANAAVHVARLEQTDAIVMRGTHFLCASVIEPFALSCQLASPYPGNIALVIYCDDLRCTMPAMAASERLLVSAAWASDVSYKSTPENAGDEIHRIVLQIHDFLDQLTSTL